MLTKDSITEHLKPVLDIAGAEVAYHQQWANNVLDILPDEDNTAPLRAVFRETCTAGSKLSHKLATFYDSYLEAQDCTLHLSQGSAPEP